MRQRLGQSAGPRPPRSGDPHPFRTRACTLAVHVVPGFCSRPPATLPAHPHLSHGQVSRRCCVPSRRPGARVLLGAAAAARALPAPHCPLPGAVQPPATRLLRPEPRPRPPPGCGDCPRRPPAGVPGPGPGTASPAPAGIRAGTAAPSLPPGGHLRALSPGAARGPPGALRAPLRELHGSDRRALRARPRSPRPEVTPLGPRTVVPARDSTTRRMKTAAASTGPTACQALFQMLSDIAPFISMATRGPRHHRYPHVTAGKLRKVSDISPSRDAGPAVPCYPTQHCCPRVKPDTETGPRRGAERAEGARLCRDPRIRAPGAVAAR